MAIYSLLNADQVQTICYGRCLLRECSMLDDVDINFVFGQALKE